jgi:hypothetical protein
MLHLPRRRALPDATAHLADLRACPRCHGLIEAVMITCPTCGRWLGRGSVALWSALVIAGGLLTTAAFFLPWLTEGRPAREHLLSGYDLARIAQHLATTAAGARPTAAASIALYLAPLAGLAMLGLVGLAPLLRLPWPVVGRLLVGLAAIPCQLALLVTLFSLGLLGDDRATTWPQLGLIATGAGSILAIAGGIGLGGPGRPPRARRRASHALTDRS